MNAFEKLSIAAEHCVEGLEPTDRLTSIVISRLVRVEYVKRPGEVTKVILNNGENDYSGFRIDYRGQTAETSIRKPADEPRKKFNQYDVFAAAQDDFVGIRVSDGSSVNTRSYPAITNERRELYTTIAGIRIADIRQVIQAENSRTE